MYVCVCVRARGRVTLIRVIAFCRARYDPPPPGPVWGTRIRVLAIAVRGIAVAIRVIAGCGPGNDPLLGLKACPSHLSRLSVCVAGCLCVCGWAAVAVSS